MSKITDVVPVCPVHGREPGSFEVGGVKFCAKCVRSHLNKTSICPLKMQQVEGYDPKDPRLLVNVLRDA